MSETLQERLALLETDIASWDVQTEREAHLIRTVCNRLGSIMRTCYICDPESPDADEEGCPNCESDFWRAVIEYHGLGEAPTP